MSKPKLLGYPKRPSNKQDKHDLRYQQNLQRKGRKVATWWPEPVKVKI